MTVTREAVVAALQTVLDPELGLDIVALGLVYAVTVVGSSVSVDVTRTSPACPLGDYVVDQIESALFGVGGVEHASVRIVWEPVWSPDRLTERARRELGWAPEAE
jgi:metal-sulfur cluster biosynthetic enzyme